MEFTAVYNTETLKNVEYSFNADSVEKAIAFCRNKFKVKDIFIVNNNNRNFPIHLGDGRKTAAIERFYIKKHRK